MADQIRGQKKGNPKGEIGKDEDWKMWKPVYAGTLGNSSNV